MHGPTFAETLSPREANPAPRDAPSTSEAPVPAPEEPAAVVEPPLAPPPLPGPVPTDPSQASALSTALSPTALAVSRRDPDDSSSNGSPRRSARPDPLDPAARHAAQMVPFNVTASVPATPVVSASVPPETQAHASLETLLPELVRKVAWSGDGRRGSMRLELGAGALAGGTLVVHADEGRVRVELDAPAGTDLGAWKARLEERLTRRGIDLDEVDVH